MKGLAIRTPVVQLSTLISPLYIHPREIPDTCHLDVVRGLDKVNTPEATIRNDTRSTTSFGAPSDLFTFRVTDVAIGQSWRQKKGLAKDLYSEE